MESGRPTALVGWVPVIADAHVKSFDTLSQMRIIVELEPELWMQEEKNRCESQQYKYTLGQVMLAPTWIAQND